MLGISLYLFLHILAWLSCTTNISYALKITFYEELKFMATGAHLLEAVINANACMKNLTKSS